MRLPEGSIPVLFSFLLLTGCANKCKKETEKYARGVGPRSLEQLVGDEGVFGSTFYSHDMDLTLTVPPTWQITNEGRIQTPDGYLEARLEIEPGRGADLDDDVQHYQHGIQAISSAYTELGSTNLEIDHEPARIVDYLHRFKGSGTDSRCVVAHIMKGDRVCRIHFRAPSSAWDPLLEKQVKETVHNITRQGSLLGGLRRALNQFEYAYEGQDLMFFWPLLADSAYWDLLHASSREIARIKTSPEVFYRDQWSLDFSNPRKIRRMDDYCSVEVDFLLRQYRRGLEIDTRRIDDHRVTFVMERGCWRLCGELCGARSWGKNLASNQGDSLPGTPPIPSFRWSASDSTVTLDASAARDFDTVRSKLQSRWDWTGDGKWDTDFSGTAIATHDYSIAGRYRALLQVKDGDDMRSVSAQEIRAGETSRAGETRQSRIDIKKSQ